MQFGGTLQSFHFILSHSLHLHQLTLFLCIRHSKYTSSVHQLEICSIRQDPSPTDYAGPHYFLVMASACIARKISMSYTPVFFNSPPEGHVLSSFDPFQALYHCTMEHFNSFWGWMVEEGSLRQAVILCDNSY